MTKNFATDTFTLFIASVLAAPGCSSSTGPKSAAPSGADAGTQGSGGSANVDVDSGSGGGKTDAGGGKAEDAGGAVIRTSAVCGSLPILGDFGPDAPQDCATCVESSCCTEAQACADDPGCSAFRDCAAGCGTLDADCRNACAGQHNPGSANGAFNSCRIGKCSACVDTSCAAEAFPAPSGAKQTTNWYLYNLVSGAPATELTVKLCDFADTDCTKPLDQGTTDAGGNVTLNVPTGPKWTNAYLEITGTGILSQINFPRGRGDLPASAAFPVLDTATAAAFQTLAGGTKVPDGGVVTGGSIGILGMSCENNALAGVSFEASNAGPDTATSYISGGVPSRTATETTGVGQGAIVNVPAGKTTITMKMASSGKTLGSVDVLVRDGWYTTCSVPVGP